MLAHELKEPNSMFGEARSKGKKPRPLIWIDLDGAVEHSGKLEKKGSKIRNWKQRFFEFDPSS